jgi:hypothetical protein
VTWDWLGLATRLLGDVAFVDVFTIRGRICMSIQPNDRFVAHNLPPVGVSIKARSCDTRVVHLLDLVVLGALTFAAATCTKVLLELQSAPLGQLKHSY